MQLAADLLPTEGQEDLQRRSALEAELRRATRAKALALKNISVPMLSKATSLERDRLLIASILAGLMVSGIKIAKLTVGVADVSGVAPKTFLIGLAITLTYLTASMVMMAWVDRQRWTANVWLEMQPCIGASNRFLERMSALYEEVARLHSTSANELEELAIRRKPFEERLARIERPAENQTDWAAHDRASAARREIFEELSKLTEEFDQRPSAARIGELAALHSYASSGVDQVYDLARRHARQATITLSLYVLLPSLVGVLAALGLVWRALS